MDRRKGAGRAGRRPGDKVFTKKARVLKGQEDLTPESSDVDSENQTRPPIKKVIKAKRNGKKIFIRVEDIFDATTCEEGSSSDESSSCRPSMRTEMPAKSAAQPAIIANPRRTEMPAKSAAQPAIIAVPRRTEMPAKSAAQPAIIANPRRTEMPAKSAAQPAIIAVPRRTEMPAESVAQPAIIANPRRTEMPAKSAAQPAIIANPRRTEMPAKSAAQPAIIADPVTEVHTTAGKKDWRNKHSRGYTFQYLHLLHQQLYTDCSFNLRDKQGNFKNFRCHKVVLARASQVFADMLFGPTAEQSENIVLVGIEHEAFSYMLEFIYSGSVTIKSINPMRLMSYLCVAASRFQLVNLVNNCSMYLRDTITSQNVCKFVHFASTNHLVQLQEDCLKVMRDNTLEVLKSPEFLQSTAATLHLMLSQPYLRVSSELEIVEACVQWAEQKAKSKNLQKLSLGKVLGAPRQLIRFLTLTPAQFKQGPGKSDLLTQGEKLAIIMALGSPSQICTLPNGLSTNRTHRNNL